MPSILFVCTANICRSPLAMVLFREKVGLDVDNWRVESAGTWAYDGSPAAEMVRQVLSERGLDISDHRSRMVTKELLSNFDLILTMEQGHMEALKAEFPDLANRVYMLSEVIGQRFDITDPIGGIQYEFEQTAREFERIFDLGFEKILQLIQQSSPSQDG